MSTLEQAIGIAARAHAGQRDPGEPYDEFILRVSVNPISGRVKLADLSDNLDLRRLPAPSQEDFDRVVKYERAKAMLLGIEPTS